MRETLYLKFIKSGSWGSIILPRCFRLKDLRLTYALTKMKSCIIYKKASSKTSQPNKTTSIFSFTCIMSKEWWVKRGIVFFEQKTFFRTNKIFRESGRRSEINEQYTNGIDPLKEIKRWSFLDNEWKKEWFKNCWTNLKNTIVSFTERTIFWNKLFKKR